MIERGVLEHCTEDMLYLMQKSDIKDPNMQNQANVQKYLCFIIQLNSNNKCAEPGKNSLTIVSKCKKFDETCDNASMKPL